MPVHRRLLLGLTLIASCQVYDETLLQRGESSQTGGRPASSGGGSAGSSGGAGGAGGVPGNGGTLPSNGGAQPSAAGGKTGSGGRSSTGGSNTTAFTGGRSQAGGTTPSGDGGAAMTEAGAAGAAGSGLEGGAPGGSGGETGDAGSGGTTGGSTGGTSTGGNPATGGMSGAGESCSGCARMQVEITTWTSRAHFKIMLPEPTDLRTASITFVVQRFAGSGGQLRGFIQSGANLAYYDGAITELRDISDTDMQSIVWDLSNLALNVRSDVSYIGIQLSGYGDETEFTNPTVVYLDSVRVTGSALDRDYWPFDDEDSVYLPVEDVCSVCATTGQIRLDSDFTAPATLRWLGD